MSATESFCTTCGGHLRLVNGGAEPDEWSHDERANHEPTPAAQLAKDVLMLAAVGGMPDTYWLADSRIQRACEVLGWTHVHARAWAQRQADLPEELKQ